MRASLAADDTGSGERASRAPSILRTHRTEPRALTAASPGRPRKGASGAAETVGHYQVTADGEASACDSLATRTAARSYRMISAETYPVLISVGSSRMIR